MSSSNRDKEVFGKVAPGKIVRARSLWQMMSLPEVMIWQRLRPKVNKDFHFRRQVPLLGKVTVDFYYAPLKLSSKLTVAPTNGNKKSTWSLINFLDKPELR